MGGIGLTLLLSQCSFEKPASPQWDIDLNLPLINKTYTIEELVEDTDEIVTDSLGNLSFSYEADIDTFSAAGQLSVEGVSEGFSQSLGVGEKPVEAIGQVRGHAETY